jgi:hypothetical protein
LALAWGGKVGAEPPAPITQREEIDQFVGAMTWL